MCQASRSNHCGWIFEQVAGFVLDLWINCDDPRKPPKPRMSNSPSVTRRSSGRRKQRNVPVETGSQGRRVDTSHWTTPKARCCVPGSASAASGEGSFRRRRAAHAAGGALAPNFPQCGVDRSPPPPSQGMCITRTPRGLPPSFSSRQSVGPPGRSPPVHHGDCLGARPEGSAVKCYGDAFCGLMGRRHSSPIGDSFCGRCRREQSGPVTGVGTPNAETAPRS